MYCFPSLEPVHCSMSGSNCCFLSCIQVSQEAGKMVWYSHILKNFPQFVTIHSQVNKTGLEFFWNSLAFSVIQQMLAIWSLTPLPFLNPACVSGSSRFTYCWSLAWRILSITLVACETNTLMWQFEHYLALPFFGIGKKVDLFHCWVFQISCHIECNTLTTSSLSIWNNLAGNPSPPIALFIVMLPKAHLTDVWL